MTLATMRHVPSSRVSTVLLGATLASLLFVVTYHIYVETARPAAVEYMLVMDETDRDGGFNPRESVAVLIAGQCSRFLYRDQLSSEPTTSLWAYDPTILPRLQTDVYIVLQCGQKQPPLNGAVETPPYMETVNVTDIEQWYLDQGADTVTVRLLLDDELDVTYEAITQSAMNVYGDYYEFKLSWMIGTPRWGIEVRKFYLRHLAFAMATAKQHYSAYVFWRDDNYFYEPLDLDNLFFDKHKPIDDPYLVVDKHCENEAFSDKIYIANHQGAALLFSSTLPEFMAWMKRYLLFGFFQKERKEETLSPEKFVHDTIGNADVDRADLARVDARYVNGALCVPEAYFACMPFATKKYLTKEHDLSPCEK